MKNIWLIQPSDMSLHSVFLPYSIGALAAYAFKEPFVRKHYLLNPLVFLKEDINQVLAKIKDPYLIGFSCYLWNVDYNLSLAAAIKKEWPSCVSVFGGPQIPEDPEYLKKHPQIDIAIIGEGELPFRQLLIQLGKEESVDRIPNLLIRRGDDIYATKKLSPTGLDDYPSPYVEGYFDEILSDPRFSDVQFDVVVETNRGCPYRCAYCSWGTNNTAVRAFPMDKVIAELEWVAQHKIPYCICADANFGILKRDEEITDIVVSLKRQYGFPLKFETLSELNKGDVAFRINKKLNDAKLNRGVSVSVQSLTPTVLHNIGRKNMSFEHFSAELKRYRDAGIFTYTDLILGLPGETFDSFCDSLFHVIEAGQHDFIAIFPLELLPNSALNMPKNIEKYGIKTITSRFYRAHSPIDKNRGSLSQLVVETKTMSKEDWQKMIRISTCVKAFHCFGLLRFIAIYLRRACNVSYKDFYLQVFSYLENSHFAMNRLVDYVHRSVGRFLKGEGDLVFFDSRYGNMNIPFEEGLFACAVLESEEFFADVKNSVAPFFSDDILLDDLLLFQKSSIAMPYTANHTERFVYDWDSYFSDVNQVSQLPIKKTNEINYEPEQFDSLIDFFREIVMYGKRTGRIMVQNKTKRYVAG